MRLFRVTRIRTRLLAAYMSILVVGFAGLTLVVGRQISSAVKADYERQLLNEIILIAQGLKPFFVNSSHNPEEATFEELDAIMLEYEDQVGGQLALFGLDEGVLGFNPDFARNSFRGMPEMENAMRNDIVVVERHNRDRIPYFYTAAPVLHGRDYQPTLLVQLAVPVDQIRVLIFRRWVMLWSIFGIVTTLALLATIIVAQSIIKPLYSLRNSAARLSQGNLSHRITNVTRDEIGDVAKTFNEMAQQVESMIEEQRAFASNTSHELRTPLTTIRLRTEALRYDDLDDETKQQYIEEIDSEVIRLSNLIQDLTLLSRLDAGRAELGREQIDFVRFAQSLQTQMAHPAAAKSIEIHLDAPSEPLLVYASLSHLTIVFRNLLDNAIKYTPENGEVCWTIQVNPGDPEQLISTIKDNGQGIDAKHLSRIFERFYRADPSRSRDIPGTGLGLALVQSIVESYNGTIEIYSEGVGKGTQVTVMWQLHTETDPITRQ